MSGLKQRGTRTAEPKDTLGVPAEADSGHSGRDRERTRQLLIDAVGTVLARSGFRGLGVNAIAREANVDKVLIYRYFGGMPELLEAFVERSDCWPREDALQSEGPEEQAPIPQELAAPALIRFGRAIRQQPMTQEILRWELFERNELIDVLAAVRERQARRMLAQLPDDYGVDLPAIAALIASGFTYLALRAKTADTYNDIALGTEEGWARLEQAATRIVGLAFTEVVSRRSVAEQKARVCPAVVDGRP